MAAKGLVRHLLRSDDFKEIENNILGFITSRNDKDAIEGDYLESLDIIVSHMIETYMNTSDESRQIKTKVILDKILTDICLPLLRIPRPSTYDSDKGRKMKVFQLNYKLVSKITCGCPFEAGQHVWLQLLKSFKNFVDECKHGFGEGHEVGSSEEVFEVATALDLLGSLLESMPNWDKYERVKLRKSDVIEEDMVMDECIFAAVLDVLKVVRSGSLLFKITGKILPRLLFLNEEKLFQNSKAIWEIVKDLLLQEQNESKNFSGFFGSYAIMSSLSDVYFTCNTRAVFKVYHDPTFWTLLQTGLVNIDPLVRKRCLYLLQKAVQVFRESCEQVFVEESSPIFWWDPDNADTLLKVWQQYVFLFEILEEKQLHVIQPVLPRLSDLIDATKKTNVLPCPWLHVSWLTVLIHRAAIHENRFIKKWAIMCLMTLDLQEVPLLENTVTRRFTSDTFIMLLKEPTLYAKNDNEGKGEPSKLSKELTSFFKKCFAALADDHKTEFVNQVLISIHQYNISHVPLTYICQGLANIPHYDVFGPELLTNIRLILCNMTSHSVVLRGAVQTFLLRTFINLLNPRSVSLDEVFVFLGLFVREESLCRGIPLWQEVGQWLSMNVCLCQRETKDLFLFLERKIQVFLKDSYSEKISAQAVRLAKFILLCCDCSVITASQMFQVCDTIFLTINKAESSAYYPISNCWQAVELLRALFYELQPIVRSETVADNIVITLTNRLHKVLLGLMQCLLRTLQQGDECASFHGYRICFKMLDEVKSLWLRQKFPDNISRIYEALINQLAEKGLHFLTAETLAKPTTTKDWLRFVVAIKWMVWVLDFSSIQNVTLAAEYKGRFFELVRSWNLVNDLRHPSRSREASNIDHSQRGSTLMQDNWRSVAEDFVAAQWQCVNRAVQDKHCGSLESGFETSVSGVCTLAGSGISDIVNACIEALSLVSGPASLPCLETLQLFLPKLLAVCDERTSACLLESAWSVLHEIRTRYSAHFWSALDIVVRIVFAPELLCLPADQPLTSPVVKYWASLLNIAHDQSGLVSIAVGHICKVFSSADNLIPTNDRMQSLQSHVGMFADICLFGPVHKKDLRLLFDTTAYIKSMGQECAAVCLTKRKEFECEFARVRVDVLAFLLNLDVRERGCISFFEELIGELLQRNQVLSEAKASRFLNSENHRQKQRLWQIISVLVCRIHDEAFALEFAMKVLQALPSDNQTSVRFLMEWILVRVFSKHLNHLDVIWRQLNCVSKKRLGYVASLVNIVTHIFLTLEEPRAQIDYLLRLFPAIIPCAFLNHSLTRAYILDALQLICSVCEGDVWRLVIERFPVAESCLAFADSVVEGVKEKSRLQKDRALFSLHPLNDFSIEAIFETVPKVAGVVAEEIVVPGDFQNKGSLPWVDVKDVPLYRQIRRNETDDGREKANVRSGSEGEGDDVGKNDALESVNTIDVQKKITPWQVTASPEEDLDLFDQLQQRPVQRRIGDLVVVASLIDRAPNLGGLCRTCEIFGASKLIVGSKHVISEIGFQSVSVSSEKWVDVEEVKVTDLVRYLSKMREEGFTIVGVEQTANSKKLTDFQFPCNTVLVLGNEKAGIPVEMIQLLDECVEIPQHGIIRSLNVHVSGALFIWEYSRQHLNDT